MNDELIYGRVTIVWDGFGGDWEYFDGARIEKGDPVSIVFQDGRIFYVRNWYAILFSPKELCGTGEALSPLLKRFLPSDN